MFLAFALEAVAMALWLATRGDPVLFVLLSGVVFFGWGEIFSLFPSTLTDTFGRANATRNYGCLYMAQGIGSIFGGPLASLLHDAAGTWTDRVLCCDRGGCADGGAGDRRAEADAGAVSGACLGRGWAALCCFVPPSPRRGGSAGRLVLA